MLRYLRLLLSLVLSGSIFGLGFLIMSIMDPSLGAGGIFHGSYLKLIAVSLIPFLGVLTQTKFLHLPKTNDIICNSVLLECSLDVIVSVRIEEAIQIVENAYNAVFFSNRVLYLIEKNEKELYYQTRRRRFTIEQKSKSREWFVDIDIVAEFEQLPSTTRVKIKSSNLSTVSFSNNRENEEHIKLIFDEFIQRGILNYSIN